MSKGQQDKKDGSSYYGFDSSGLEKAATVSSINYSKDLFYLYSRLLNIWINQKMQKRHFHQLWTKRKHDNQKLKIKKYKEKYRELKQQKMRGERLFNMKLRWQKEERNIKYNWNYKEIKIN